MICKYQELTRLEMEQVDRANTIVLIPLGALEQHGNQAPLGRMAANLSIKKYPMM